MTKQTSFIIFLTIICGALFVRLYGLSEYDFSDDELWHLTVASQDSLWDLIQYNFREEVHPPLSYIIWHYMLKISHNDLWLRMSSIIPSLLLIPSVYLFGRLYIGKAAGYCMAFIFAFGAVPISIGTVIRGYSWMMLALTWAAIFLYKYSFLITKKIKKTSVCTFDIWDGDPRKAGRDSCSVSVSRMDKGQKKYLICYFLCSLIAIELNHSAIFTIAVFGLIMLLIALQEKNKKDFVIISVIHVFLVLCVGCYVFVLNYFYNFEGVVFLFSKKDFLEYLMNYITFFLHFVIGSEVKDEVAEIINFLSVLSLIIAPLQMIKDRKWQLLLLVFAPVLIVFCTDYLRIYPFSNFIRNNLFLFFSVIILHGYLIQKCANFFTKFEYKKWFESRQNIASSLQIFVAVVFVSLSTFYVIQHNVFRNVYPGCYEFIVKKSDTKLLWSKLSSLNQSDNIFVTLVRDVWTLRFKNGDTNHLKILTKNLGKFESEDFTVYFTAFPPRQASTAMSLFEYQVFFKDLFSHLQTEGNLKKVKSFTFFDIGLNNDFLFVNFFPQFVNLVNDPFVASKYKVDIEEAKNGYNFGWALHSSSQVLERFYFRDHNFKCGREVLVLSITPKFVRDEIFTKHLVDMRKIYAKDILND